MKKIYLGSAPIKPPTRGGDSGIVQRDGEPYYKISNYQDMSPFFVTLVSGSEHWMFLSSTGGLTCGRRNPDCALFPYYTDDKIHDACSTTGSRTIVLVDRQEETRLWQPFEPGCSVYALERNLYKNLPGNKLIYEEINHDLGLAFSYRWSNTERFGFVKKSTLTNLGDTACPVEFLDGLRNLLPYGVTQQMQDEMSTLLDGYKQAERVPGSPVGIYTLSSILTDRAEPCEALRATVVWSQGLQGAGVLLTEDQLDAFCAGAGVTPEDHARGKRGAFFVQAALTLPEKSEKSWHLLADVNQGAARLTSLLGDIRQGITAEAIEADIDAGTRQLVRLVDSADGCQKSADTLIAARHFSNTLFNIMRGGAFYDGYNFPAADFLDFVTTWNAPLRAEYSALLSREVEPHTLESVTKIAAESGEVDLERLALEYLPLTFSRRHGDPSRPWNRFSIDIRNADGSDKLYFQGNWRDIFQNWEALSLSYPEYIESFIAKFLNASTADGYNPYRITRDGIDWEVLESGNSWSNIGYWGDHQINYLLKLLELSRKYHPGKIGGYLEREIFVFANVPYRIKGYDALLTDPRNTVDYDYAEEQEIARRVAALGSDGKLVTQPDGSIYRVNMFEKLFLPALTKIGNFVPDGGIWMNTQRPEWNDANNALVGYGLSMVTLCYLRRYLGELAGLLVSSPADAFPVSDEVHGFFTAIDAVLRDQRPSPEAEFTADRRKAVVDGLGAAGEAYRESVYAGISGKKSPLDKSAVLRFIDMALEFCDHTIASNRRSDGLYHAYNLIHFESDGFEIEHLYEMLEGQVAVLSSGYLKPKDSLALLDSLRSSAIYRADQNSYMLYPDREQARFLEKNVIPESLRAANDWIGRELEAPHNGLIEQDAEGRVHFHGDLRNVNDLRGVLRSRPDVSAEDADAICRVYEVVFRHRRFTGRSGSMFKYEGLGCIYWHMVSKLLLAAAEVIEGAGRSGTDKTTFNGLLERFDDIKDGLGLHKTPDRYGAFTTDAYSHTPGFNGVQQPGMTGQVKEDIVTRFIELGVSVNDGQIEFTPSMLRREEFLVEPTAWSYASVGQSRVLKLAAGSLAFSVCGVPVIYRLADRYAIQVEAQDGSVHSIESNHLGPDWSRSLFCRDGRIQSIQVDIRRDEPR
jgi:hypothetical protein